MLRQARNDLKRLRDQAAELAALREEAGRLRGDLQAIRRSLVWRGTAPLRRVVEHVPSGFRGSVRRSVGRLRQRAAVLRPDSSHEDPVAAAITTTDPPVLSKPTALVVDDHWPQPDRDSGSIDIVNMVDALLALGFEVAFGADLDFSLHSEAREALLAKGIHCLGRNDAESVRDYIERYGGTLDLCILNRVFCGGKFLEIAQSACAKARLVFNSIDLHFLRLQREADVSSAGVAREIIEQVKKRELQVIAGADATIVVSSVERQVLSEVLSDSMLIELPLARPVDDAPAPFAERRDIGFIGGFAHAPNVDALRYFLAAIWPQISAGHPDCRFQIVGSDLPPAVLAGAPDSVVYLGQIPHIESWFSSIRVTVAPLRYGAGAKGKVASSLAAGVPCVLTPIAGEGMGLEHGINALVAEEPGLFAELVAAVYDDEALWTRLSSNSLAFARLELSVDNWRRRVTDMLRLLGVVG